MGHGVDHGREGQTQNTSESVVDADSPSHTLLTLDGREDLSRVLEGNGSFAEGVGDREQIDETEVEMRQRE